MKNLITRILSGSVYVALIFTGIYLTKYTPIPFLVVFSLFTLVGMWEITRLSNQADAQSPLISLIDMIGGLAVFLSFFIMYTGSESRSLWLLPILIYLVARGITQLYLPSVHAIHSLERSMMSIVYVALPLGLLNSICAMMSPMMLLAIFIFIWINDSGAYVVGCSIGKHRLFERISPKKSWEGFWGGMVFCIAMAFVFYYFTGSTFGTLNLWQWIVLAIIVSAFATWGDLLESLIKRTAGVKDSSNLIPGHGGLLDRIDSLLMVVPASLIFFIIIKLYC
ncbi:MAG: phosphatidate cytidylyltransferase [Muribaculaceae bacterium]|nr:phosphatidate cytidylyltransferase [Muribaculaceae bacterium]